MLDDILPEAFAVVREAGRRVLGQRHFDVQIMGGAALHFGWVAEMKTGEGKTLVVTLPAYLNALAGGGVHLVTVNDYLARRDAEWMGRSAPVPRARRSASSSPTIDDSEREAPRSTTADITYGTNNEFGFDYLRDNMVVDIDEQVQRGIATSRGRRTTSRSSTRSTRSSSTRPARRSSSPGRAADAAELYYQFARDREGSAARPRLRGRRGQAHRRAHRGGHRRASSRRSASRTSTRTSTRTSCTSSSRRCAARSCSSATSTTSSRTAR